jgi:hypothetical protein
MNIVLTNAGMEVTVDVPLGSSAGFVRRLSDDLEEIGAPSTYTISVNGESVTDDVILSPGARIAFRPVSSEKG